jgi:hypothetical protein
MNQTVSSLTNTSWDIDDAQLRNFNMREYSGATDQPNAYINDLVGLLQIEKCAWASKTIHINTGILMREADFQMIIAAIKPSEMMNDPLRWTIK